jgi:hypothetical protein
MAEYLAKHSFSYQFLNDVKDQWMKGNRGTYGEWK